MHKRTKPLSEWIDAWSERLFFYGSPIIVPLVAYILVRIATEGAMALNGAVGLAVALAFVAGAEMWRRTVGTRFFEHQPGRVVLTVLGVLLATAVSAFASISYVLMTSQWGAYEIRSDYPGYSVGTFADHYGWVLVDMLPGLDVWKTLGVDEPPVRPVGFWAGIPIVAFRVFVLLGLLESYQTWRDRGRRASKAAA